MKLSDIGKLLRKWFPRRPDRAAWQERLRNFYQTSQPYHAMTHSNEKESHPQVRLLTCLLTPGESYVEVGCGGGAASRVVGEVGRVLGFDVSEIALRRARDYCRGVSASFCCAPAAALPVRSNSVAGCFSFEVLEHVWDPLAAAAEMVRVTRPGGFILISTPNAFSLDYHLAKRGTIRVVEMCLAGIRYGVEWLSRRPYVNLIPDIDGDVYPDCDSVSVLIPRNFCRALVALGCTVDFCDATFMCAHRDRSTTDLSYQRKTASPFLRNFGDHVLILAHKD